MGKNAAGLFLVGLGIGDEGGISLSGLEALRGCEKIFAETYTCLLPEGALARLEAHAGAPIAPLSREQVEAEEEILAPASESPTALVVAGDPMIATTHVSLVLAARKRGIRVEILHAASIISAAMGESGLQAYKFGKTATIAFWRENYRPMAAYCVISENLARGLHTLLLLDIDEKLGPMGPSEAAELLLEMEKHGGRGILLPETKAVLLSRTGRSDAKTEFLSLRTLAGAGTASACQPPAVLILPGRLHFLEEESLASLG